MDRLNYWHRVFAFLCFSLVSANSFSQAQDSLQAQHLTKLQQQFVDLRFGMFIHYNIPTYTNADWPDPDASPAIFDPKKLDPDQWAKAAKSANMSYGCLTTKHHSGFCIWDTKTTEYSVKNSPYKKDVVKQFVEAFRGNGLKVMLYYSILDTHHGLRPNQITKEHITLVKAQITELLTNYGKIEALIIDGWDAPWSRISYEQIPFEDIYLLVKKLQPDCLVMDLNSAKYPGEGLYYTDIKTYEMGAGQRMSMDQQRMPSLACLPINTSWFWKTNFPEVPVRDPKKTVKELIEPLNAASCDFILNVAPNRDGLIDDNAVAGLQQIGKLWSNNGATTKLPKTVLPIISANLAKGKISNSSWSDDMNIMDFANDDDFKTSWVSSPTIKNPWYEISFETETAINMAVIAETVSNIESYILSYWNGTSWQQLFSGRNTHAVKVHRFNRIWTNKIKIEINSSKKTASISEFQLFNERR